MNLARCLRILLAVALLAAWQNALVHPIEHVDEAGSFIHLAGAHNGEQPNGNAPDPQCDALAAVAAGVAGPSGFEFAVPQGVETFSSRQARQIRNAPLLAYRSQAPPELL